MRQPLNLGSRTLFISSFILALGYISALCALYFLLYESGVLRVHPTATNLLRWDATWYKSIADKGYYFDAAAQSNSGFFYLFPVMWRVSHLGVYGVCVLNIFLFVTGFATLVAIFKPSVPVRMLWLSFPAVCYMFVPYSEALFFFLSCLCVWGLKCDRPWVTAFALFLLSLTRATSVILMAAFLIMALMGAGRESWKKSMRTYIIWHFTPLLLGLVTFIAIQYWQTGVWFAYFIQQSKHWGHKLNQPEFPLQNGINPGLTWLGALSVFVCVVSTGGLVKKICRWVRDNETFEKSIVLSQAYFLMLLFIILFMNIPSEVTGGFRYTMANPFFDIVLLYFVSKKYERKKDFLIAIIIATIVWLAFSYKNLHLFILLQVDSLIVLLFMLLPNKKLLWSYYILIVLGLLIQLHLFEQFIGDSIIVD